jgi:hypothetical protein
MYNRPGPVWEIRVLVLVSIVALTVSLAGAATIQPVPLSPAALQALVPEGYRIVRTIACDPSSRGRAEYLVALSDVDESEPMRPVMLLLVAAGDKAIVEDSLLLHNESRGPREPSLAPNYLSDMARERVGEGDLLLVTTIGSWGGSGSIHYFDFFRPEKHKLRLVKGFSHGRMEVPYFALYGNAAYDAELICSRGEKRGKAYEYTCYLQVTKFVFANNQMLPVSSERMREQRGNRYLQDKFRFVSVLKALRNHEIFAAP